MDKKTTMANSATGFINQSITILLEFIIRTVTIWYLGIEIVGINGTFTSVLYTLSLADLGFQSAIVFSLYKPLHEDDRDRVNDLINIIKVVYRGIGLFILIASLVVLPFLKYILTNITIDERVYIMFILQALSSVATYFMAYKRTLLYADRRSYVPQIVDILTQIVFGILEVYVIIALSNYYAYLTLKLLRIIVSNVIIHVMGSKSYPFLRRAPVNKQLFSKVFTNVKDVFAGRIAGYIYSSTDPIVISAFISTVAVGFYTNYTTIIEGLRLITGSLTQPVIPTIGNYLLKEKETDKRLSYFYEYSHLRYLLAILIVIPEYLVINEFVTMCFGEKYILSDLFLFLISIELYIHIVHSSTYDFIHALGLFKKDKYVELAGAVTNITLSIILAKVWGIEGVITGTVMAQLVFWIGRSWLVFRDGFEVKIMRYVKYWLRNVFYLVYITCIFIIDRYILGFIRIQEGLVHFIVTIVVIELVSVALVGVSLFWMTEQKQVYALIFSRIRQGEKK